MVLLWLKKQKGLSQNMEGPIQKQGRSELKKEGLVDNSQSSYIITPFTFLYLCTLDMQNVCLQTYRTTEYAKK